jgi:Na+-transporting NADH:ubiquinone oxidoreductase subunit NqrC
MTAISPLGAEYFDQGSQPGVAAAVSPGRWQVKMHLYSGCSVYDVILLYY